MTIPSKPYATSVQVALLLPMLMNGNSDFNDTTTTPRKAQVDQYLLWIANQIDMQFQQAGYVIPFTELSGETWPEHQTYYLALLNSLGAAALAGGHVLKPAPAMQPGRGSSGNIYQDMYNAELNKIWESFSKSSNIRFRCMAYSGTPAEKSITEPTGPYLDYQAGKMNQEDFMMLWDYTDLKKSITDYVVTEYGSLGVDDFTSLFENKDWY